MVSISDQNPEIKRQTDGQQPSVTTSTPANDNAGIFRVGLTRTEAANDTQLNSLFTKYNTDGDDSISQSEFDAYTKETSNQQQQDITSVSGKRTAVGGIYTIQKGDCLSAIAKDFGMSVSELYQANVDVIGKSINSTIHPGQQLQITKVQTQADEKPQTVKSDNKTISTPEESAQEVRNAKIAKMMEAFGLDANSGDLKALYQKFKQLAPEQKHQIMDNLLNIYIDFEKVNENFKDKSLDEIAAMIGVSQKAWKNADWTQKGTLMAESMNKMYKADLDENDENSGYNKALARLKTEGPTQKERELYKKQFNFDNLSEEDYKKLAQLSVTQGYISTNLAIAHENIHKGENEAFAIVFDSYMKSLFKDEDITNFLMFIGGQHQDQLKEYIGTLSNSFAETFSAGENSNLALRAFALEVVANNADAQHLANLYQNNPDLENTLNKVLSYVAENTTDESRKAMLNNIVENSASIIQGNNNPSASQNSTGGQGSSASVSSGLAMTNPIQNSIQINYINDLKQASERFHNQTAYDVDTSIPQEYKAAFSTIREYIDFKGTGMTMAEYQRAKSVIRNNFTSVMNEMIENYANIPDKFKPRILAFFDSMDNNTSGELYLNANDKVRQFMDKYNYMNNEKLKQYIEIHPACINDAPKNVQQMIKELQEQASRGTSE